MGIPRTDSTSFSRTSAASFPAPRIQPLRFEFKHQPLDFLSASSTPDMDFLVFVHVHSPPKTLRRRGVDGMTFTTTWMWEFHAFYFWYLIDKMSEDGWCRKLMVCETGRSHPQDSNDLSALLC
jgi:hypothetical protein